MRTFNRGSFLAATKTIRANRGRSFMTILGIIIGVASAVVMVGIGQGIKVQVQNQIGQLDKNVVVIRPGAPGTGRGLLGQVGSLTYHSSTTLSDRDVQALRTVDTVGSVTPLSTLDGVVKADDNKGSFDGAIIGTTNDLPSVLHRKVEFGAFFSNEESAEHRAVIGSDIAASLFGEAVPLGRSFELRGQDFIVVGIMQRFNDVPLAVGVDFNNAIFIPYATAQKLSSRTALVYEVFVTPRDGTADDAMVRQVTRKLTAVHGGQQSFSVMRQGQSMTTSDTVLELITTLVLGAAIISLVVGGVGIMNILFVSVTERMREIGIRKAVGATNRQILYQFMTEATVLSLLGYIAGLVVSAVILIFLLLFSTIHPVVPWQIVVVSGVMTMVIGIVFGSVPALKAARKDPIDALRNE